jgi:lysophospholipid acyltransferase (LPLAT)-like uncharacterized protein
MRFLRWLGGTLAGLAMWLVALTFRVRDTGDEHRQAARSQHPGGLLYAIWHEQQLAAITTNDDFPMVTIASRSKDGDLIAAGLRVFSVSPARGSSSRGGAEALMAVLRKVNGGSSCAVTVDGPRGPRRVGKVGICKLAALTGRPIIPTIFVPSSSWRTRSWDRFEIPKPFARIARTFGAPIWVRAEDDLDAKAAEVTRAISALLGPPDGEQRHQADEQRQEHE